MPRCLRFLFVCLFYDLYFCCCSFLCFVLLSLVLGFLLCCVFFILFYLFNFVFVFCKTKEYNAVKNIFVPYTFKAV